MKRLFSVFAVLLCICMLFAGCDNDFAEKEYNDNAKIVESADRYAKTVSTFKKSNDNFSLEAGKFDGRETLWQKTLKTEEEIEFEVSLKLNEGTAKLVYIDNDNNVSIVAECSSETSKEQSKTEKLTLKKGKNRLKIVGKGCKNLSLKFEIKTAE